MAIDWDKVEKEITDFGSEIYPFEECTIEYPIGIGGAMEVFKGQCKINMVYKDVAFKRHREFKKYKLRQKDVNGVLEDFRHEIQFMTRLKHHTNIVQIYGVTFEERRPILIVELCHDTIAGYLSEKAESNAPATWREKIKLCGDITRGLRSLHEAGIIHGGIKGEDVLVFINDTGIPTAKISDFGDSSTLTSRGGIGGTLIFMAPEARGIVELKPWAGKQTQDIFSFGLVIYQIANDGTEDAEQISEADPTNRHTEILLLGLPPSTPEVFRKIITETTKYMPTERASLDIVEQMLYDGLDTPSPQQVTVTTNDYGVAKDISLANEETGFSEFSSTSSSSGVISSASIVLEPLPSGWETRTTLESKRTLVVRI